jgi:protocatechuate 3,4-dioxygenase beta subunit
MALRYSVPCLCIVAIFNASLAHAAPQCAPTATTPVRNYPGAANIPPSNNLMLPAGKVHEAEGQKFTLSGRVVDKNCMPIPEAVVELWQNDPFGKWHLAGGAERATPNAVFAGAGRTYTDNDGRFNFVSAFPAPLGKRAPFVNLKISAPSFRDAHTALFFSDDVRNEKDEVYKRLKPKARQDVTISMQQDEEGNLIGTVEVVLPGNAPYRTY